MLLKGNVGKKIRADLSAFEAGAELTFKASVKNGEALNEIVYVHKIWFIIPSQIQLNIYININNNIRIYI